MTFSPFRPARRARHVAALAIALTALAGVGLSAAVPASAAQAATTPAGAAAATNVPATTATPAPTPTEADAIVFTAAPSGAGVVSGTDALSLTLTAYNPTLADMAGAPVRVTTSATPLADRAATRAWLTGDASDDGRTETVLADGALPSIASRATGSASIALDPAAFTARTPGIYPIRADYTTPQGVVTARTVLTVPAATSGGSVTVVVPITAPARTTGLLTADELTKLTGPGGALRDTLDAVTGSAAVLAVDPAIVASIRVLGKAAPASAAQWLSDLMTLPNERFALQFGDADVATQIDAGLQTLLAPLALDPYMSARDFPAASGAATSPATDQPSNPSTDQPGAPGVTPSPTTTPTTALPTLAQLTDVGGAGETVYWPATGTAGSETAAALASGSESALTLIDSGAVTDAVAPAWATAGNARLIVYDADTSRALGDAAASTEVTARDAALASASAYAQFAAAGTGPLVVAIDRDAAFPSLRAALQTASALAGRTAAANLATLTTSTPQSVSLRADAPDAQRVGDLQTLLADESALSSFSSILRDPAVLTSPERAAILQLIGNGWRSETTDAAATAFTDHRAQTRETLGAVAITPPSDITLAATSAPLSFSVRNDLRWPVSVVLTTTRLDPRLVVQETTPIEAGPSQNTRVQVPVQARVGSGESTLQLQLHSATGVAIGEPVPVHVSVHAEWESVGLVVIISLVVALLVVGAVRTVLKLRRTRRAQTATEAETQAATTAAPDGQIQKEDADG